jgi:molecular chaperone HtpG
MSAEKRSFQAEVSRLLEIVAHSLYSNKDVFLRELISNASDACDRLRYAALTQPDLIAGDPELKVTIVPDKAKRTITISDNGIGMSRQELIDNLGTIARSGTAAFVGELSGDAKKDVALIGQFGVGFYSAFMVADEVEVLSRKAGEAEAWRWISDGKGEFAVEPGERGVRGTTITLHLHEADADYADAPRLEQIVKTYSDHIALPIVLEALGKRETLNRAAALWMRPRAEITEEQYREFYHHVGHAFDDPWLTLHFKAEGTYEYTGLLFIPATKPFDLFDPARKNRAKLYVRRVFITDDCQELLPPYLRFLKGVVDSEDLPLNVSREMLQKNPMLARMRTQIARRVFTELQKKAKDAPEEYATFWENFGAVLKEGLYEERDNRDAILELARFRSTHGALVSLDEYVARMKPEQKAIYTITSDSPDLIEKSPQLEGFRARGVEVLLLADPVDAFWVSTAAGYEGKPFKSVTQGAADIKAIPLVEGAKPQSSETSAAVATLFVFFKQTLGDQIEDVRASERLTDSVACLVAPEFGPDRQLEKMLSAHGRMSARTKPILEVNAGHPLIAALARRLPNDADKSLIEDSAWLVFDEARLLEGEAPNDATAFAARLRRMMEKALA